MLKNRINLKIFNIETHVVLANFGNKENATMKLELCISNRKSRKTFGMP